MTAGCHIVDGLCAPYELRTQLTHTFQMEHILEIDVAALFFASPVGPRSQSC
jgi:hypothetical protein